VFIQEVVPKFMPDGEPDFRMVIAFMGPCIVLGVVSEQKMPIPNVLQTTVESVSEVIPFSVNDLLASDNLKGIDGRFREAIDTRDLFALVHGVIAKILKQFP